MSLIFRMATEADLDPVSGLVEHSFTGRSREEWRPFVADTSMGGIDVACVGEDRGRLVATCKIYRMEQWIAGVPIPIMGLGFVAIAPTDRRRGVAADLVQFALEQARDRGDLGSALFPFRTSFYGKLGYGTAGNAIQYRIPPDQLPDNPGRERITLVSSPGEQEELAKLYARWIPGQNGQIARGDALWKSFLEDGTRHSVLYRTEAGEATAWATFRYREHSAGTASDLDLIETGWLDAEGRRALYGWMASLSDQWRYLLYRAHPEEGFENFLEELRRSDRADPPWELWAGAASWMTGPMFRLIHLEKALARRTLNPGRTLRVALEVEDAQLPHNDGRWLWTLGEEAARCERADGAGADVKIELGISTLSRIFIGSLTPSEAVGADLARISSADPLKDLDARLRVRRPWTFERF